MTITNHMSMGNPAAPSSPFDTSSRRFYHGTRADLNRIAPGSRCGSWTNIRIGRDTPRR